MKTYFADYLSRIQSTLAQIDSTATQLIVGILHNARLEGRAIFLMGNGGSAATASHWVNDLSKGVTRAGAPCLRAIALTDKNPS